ncbi:MAG: hypothetical protein ACJ796_00065 [Gemmatimonadaceae bacterium]
MAASSALGGMLVYRATSQTADVRSELEKLAARVAEVDAKRLRDHDELRLLLIEAGMIESALLDALNVDEDDVSSVDHMFGALLSCLAMASVRSWSGETFDLRCASSALEQLRSNLPAQSVRLAVPEGFAYYGLFPETYIAPAIEIVCRHAPAGAVVVGIRSIGTTLSAIVSATLEAHGVATFRHTVRPRGHPFDRELRLSPRLTATLERRAADPNTVFVVVDEGPGLSGSSFGCAATRLGELGVPNERIVLMPSWNPPPESLANATARAVWQRHARYVGDFDREYVASGRLERRFHIRLLADVSAGAWRRFAYASSLEFPVVQPQHERRKFLAKAMNSERVLIKFEGLGTFGIPHRDRAVRLADAGFGPAVHGFADGFLALSWVDGTPMTVRDVTPSFVSHLARYAAWTRRGEAVGRPCGTRRLLELIDVNVQEGLGDAWSPAVRQLRTAVSAVERAPAVRVDGRMLPHEWLRSANGYVKTDGLAHHDDHFYPGPTDIAWDLAGACAEFELSTPARHLLLREYIARTGDTGIHSRLPLYRVAYPAFRLGYTTLAAQALGASPDGTRMRAETTRYAEQLRHALQPWLAPVAADLDRHQSYATDT